MSTPEESPADIKDWPEQLAPQSRQLSYVYEHSDYGTVAQRNGVTESCFLPTTPQRKLVDEQITRLGLVESSTVDWSQEISIPSSKQSDVPTYHDLKLHGREYFLSTGLASSSVDAYYSALNKLMVFFNLSAEASTEPHLGSAFQLSLAELRTTGDNRPVESRLRRWHEFQSHLLTDQGLPEKFSTALTLLIQGSGEDLASIARKTGIPVATLKNWLSGKNHPNDTERLRELERVLNAAPGLLTQKLPTYRVKRNRFRRIPEEWWPEDWKHQSNRYKRHAVVDQLPKNAFEGDIGNLKNLFDQAVKIVESRFRRNPYSERLKWQVRNLYVLKTRSWPEKLIAEYHAIRKYKTDPDSFANEERKSTWSDATTHIARIHLESFYGYLCLPCDLANPDRGGKGMMVHDLTMGWLSFPQIVKDYLDFRKYRSGRYNTGVVSFMGILISLLNAGSGWIYQNSDLKFNLPQEQQEQINLLGGWKNHCENSYQSLVKSFKMLQARRQITYSREPFLPISPILDLDSPLSPIIAAIEFYERELRQTEMKHSKSVPAYAAKWRNLLLLSMLVRLPLRSKHWRIMSYKEDNTGTLSKDSKGFWQITLPFSDFKNYRNKKIFVNRNSEKAITLSFNEQPLKPLVPLLELYLHNYWPTIVGDSERLFPSPTGKELTTSGLASVVRTWTREYLSEQSLRGCGVAGVLPFAIHAFRDILATHVIKVTGSIDLAADLLLDSPGIVAQHYARFLPKDRLQRVYQQLTIFDEEGS